VCLRSFLSKQIIKKRYIKITLSVKARLPGLVLSDFMQSVLSTLSLTKRPSCFRYVHHLDAIATETPGCSSSGTQRYCSFLKFSAALAHLLLR
jgi:hypothetical protein